jgi:amino acid adenylation domain-containing protein
MKVPPGNTDWLHTGGELMIQNLFEIQQQQNPDAIAVIFEGEELTYSGLNSRANALAEIILNKAGKTPIIGISTTRSIEMIIGVLAILKSGKAYLPLDPNYPADRLRQMILDSGIAVCLAVRSELLLFQSLESGIQLITTNEKNKVSGKMIPDLPGKLAYVLYTSGSTGRPKGVSMGQLALVNLLQWQKNNSVAGPETKTLQFAPLGFDVSFQEIFSTFSTGGTLVLVGDDLRLDPQRLLHFIEESSIQRIFLPFVALQFLTEAADTHKLFPGSLKEVITAGEQLKITPQVRRFFTAMPGCVLYNQYGPTECHVVTALKLTGDPVSWPDLPTIGKPIDGTEILILDGSMNLAEGESGELCIAGKSLADGYLNHPEMTKEKFIDWLHPMKGILRIYKTGDLARLQRDGNIELLGRSDEQVKIRGYRIEPGEIEVVLNGEPGIQQAIVMAREDIPGQKRLVAYLISSNGKKDTTIIRLSMEKQLPDYMIPSAFVWMDSLPKTSSGKVDKKSLPKPEMKRPELTALYKPPVTKNEKILADCWCTLLQLDRVGIFDNFFELGGNSLLALKTVALLKQNYSLELPITKLYQYPTINGISNFFDGDMKASVRSARKKAKPSDNGGDIAVIGMAGRFPGTGTIEGLWNILKAGKETISFFTSEELDPQIDEETKNNTDYVKARGIIEEAEKFDAAFFGINPKLGELMDPQQRIFLEIAWEALENGGYIPSKYKGSIGVFAGTGNNTYYLNNVQANKEKIDQVGSFQVMTVNEKDYVASRTAYELNLKGPAVSIHSACSTSLLAIAEATEAIRKGQCDIALAGGVAITVPIKSGHIYQEGAMYSRDGHCRTFDADAEGTVFSDGAGVVLLKGLEAALRDGDTIFSVIKGVGMNNDGGLKGSFTAPSAEGQAGAILMAIDDAGIDPSTISYVEAHGTATPLGDPIEIEGLNLAFGIQEKKQFCAIGSIKSNIGHLTAAAGVAGFIKTTLALYHKQIPASINYSKPNPHIDFENSPFYVNTTLKPWEVNGKRRAGISSFGVGGTNVHVVLEEFKNTGKSENVRETNPNRSLQLICWSAKTIKSREDYTTRLSEFVKVNSSLNLPDLAYTLQTRREYFKSRRFAIAQNYEELLQKLDTVPPSSADAKLQDENLTDVVFIFPGQGSQSINMGKELYDQEPVFKEAVDNCAGILLPLMNEDIRDTLYPEKINKDSEQKIHHTYYTQPALFIIEYALARLWMSWGIRPSAFIGHSIGEFVAAHLSGVFSLEEGLKLIFNRGRLMSSLQTGSMLGVRAGHEIVEPMLTADISLAAINSPGLSVVSGPEKEVSSFSEMLTEKGIANKLLQTSHAFHSAMMDPILTSFEEIAGTIHFNLPRIPIVSTLTGNWISDAEITSPAYWSKQIRYPVRFAQAVEKVSEEGFQLMLESGPGRVLSTLVRQQGIKSPLLSIPSLEKEEGKTEIYSILKALGQLWMNGINPDWDAFHSGQKRNRLQIPVYAFDRIRLWVDPVQKTTGTPSHQKDYQGIEGERLTKESKLPQKNIMRKSWLVGKLKQIFENASGIEMESADPELNFIEIGFDSLLLTQVALNLKKEFELPISFRQLNETYGNLNLLAAYLDDNLPKDRFQPSTQVGKMENIMEVQSPDPTLTASVEGSAISLITKQIQLLAQQVALLQHGNLKKESEKNIRPALEKELSVEEISELKKPFGATARIEKQTTILSESQQAYLKAFSDRYNKKTRRSKAYAQEHRSYMADPRVVSGFKPLTKEIVYSIVINKSRGSRLWDIDGNEYVDALNGFGSNFLGYQPEFITKALKQQIDRGYELGPQHELAGIVCKLICEFTRFERAALCNTGSEAVLGAMRIARTVTGRSTIVAFSGSYHGIVDEVIVRGTKILKSFPAAPGIMPEAVQNMLILDYGTEESLAIIKERAHELAAVLVEPVQSRRPEFQPVEFLRGLRKITAESGTALIFDEVITGFRMHPAGTQGLFDIQADLGTYGKVVAGGLPIGVIAGKKLYMDALDGGFWEYGDNSTPESGVTYFAGTFVRHPLALAAAKASLDYMKTKGPDLQKGLTNNTRRMADEMNDICKLRGVPLYVAQFGSLWKIKWKNEVPYGELLYTLMREKGVHIWDGFPCFLTEAHSDQDIRFIVQQFGESIKELTDAGFVPVEQSKPAETSTGIQEEPPIHGAKLGRDPQGNPAWFVSDPSRPGKYKQLNRK